MTADTLSDLGVLFLGSRLKRLGDRLQTEAGAILQALDLPIQPAQQPILAVLAREGALTVGQVAQHLRMSQPTATRAIQMLEEQGLVEASKEGRDQRHKRLSLSPAGQALMRRLQGDLWPRVEAAAIGICGGRHQDLLAAIAAVEAELDRRSLMERTLAERTPGQPTAPPPAVVMRDYDEALAEPFYRINAEWIGEMFALEANDIDMLSNPRERIVEPGGAILFAETADLGVVGTCALMKAKDGWFELTKMAVSKSARGRKVGEVLLQRTLDRARAMGAADQLYLLTNTKCAAAIHLYEKHGFEHDAEVMRRFGARYERCNVAMRFRG
jgi:DNA-binding MarR family transcriptional regulator/GNAT superfamily N-acetyltransferase